MNRALRKEKSHRARRKHRIPSGIEEDVGDWPRRVAHSFDLVSIKNTVGSPRAGGPLKPGFGLSGGVRGGWPSLLISLASAIQRAAPSFALFAKGGSLKCPRNAITQPGHPTLFSARPNVARTPRPRFSSMPGCLLWPCHATISAALPSARGTFAFCPVRDICILSRQGHLHSVPSGTSAFCPVRDI